MKPRTYRMQSLVEWLSGCKIVTNGQSCLLHAYFEYFYRKEAKKLPAKKFDSYMLQDDDLVLGSMRLLEVDNRLVLPTKTHVRFLITAKDVLHSFAVPALGIKLDACPGRLNQTSVYIKRPGVFYGQCSEICGVGHSYMPIVIQAVPTVKEYYKWYVQDL